MPKTKISEFSATPASNTDIDSINIAEGCAPSGINDAIRELMAQLKDWQSGTSNDPMVIGSSGSLTLSQGTANGVTYLNGSKVVTSGTALVFDGTNLGVGTSSPSALLDIQGATGVIRNTATTGTNQVYTRQGNTGGFFYTGLDTSAGGFLTGSAYAGFLWMSGAYPMIFGTSNAERARIDSSGNLLVGSTTATITAKLGIYQTTTDAGIFINPSNASYNGTVIYTNTTRAASASFDFLGMYANSTNQFRVSGSGVIYAQNTSVQSISDQRLKENIRDSSDGLSVINGLRPVRYDWKEGYGNDRKDQLGFIAQEVEAIFPEAVSEWQVNKEDETVYKTVGPSAFIPVLVKAIQEQQAIIESLKARLDAANL